MKNGVDKMLNTGIKWVDDVVNDEVIINNVKKAMGRGRKNKSEIPKCKGVPNNYKFNNTTGNSEFVLGEKTKITRSYDYLTILDLDDEVGEICDAVLWGWFTPSYRYMHIRIIPSVNF